MRASYDGPAIPAIPPESCRLAATLARPLLRGLLTIRAAIAAVVLDAARRDFACAPHLLTVYATHALHEGMRAQEVREARALNLIRRAVWPLTKDRAPGSTVYAAAQNANQACGTPLRPDEVLAECRHIALATRGSTHARGR